MKKIDINDDMEVNDDDISKTCLLTNQTFFHKVHTQTSGTIFRDDLLDIALLNLWCCYYVPLYIISLKNISSCSNFYSAH